MFSVLGMLTGGTVLWWALLWLVLPLVFPVDWKSISPSAMLLIHVMPPMLLTFGRQWWQARQEKKAEEEAAEQAQADEAERAAQRDAAREQHLAKLGERHQAVTCRWLWAAALPVKDEPEWFAELPDGCQWQQLAAQEDAMSALDYLAEPVQHAFAELYGTLPGAASLPLLQEIIPGESGIEQMAALKAWQQQAWLQVSVQDMPQQDCRFLAGSGSVGDRVLQYLQQDPELPGVLVLAADSPLAALGTDGLTEPDTYSQQQWRQTGKPGAAIVLMLFLRDDLPPPAFIAPTEGQQETKDIYQPYWERPLGSSGAGWGRVPAADQAALAELPSLARLTQASISQQTASSTIQLSRQMQPLLDNALVNANLLDYPFAAEDAQPEANQAATIGWLVHNSGEVETGGMRLAAIASNLTRHQIELNPIDDASNSVREWGNVGAALPAMLTALAVTHCARLATPVVLTCFAHDHIALSLARPLPQEGSA